MGLNGTGIEEIVGLVKEFASSANPHGMDLKKIPFGRDFMQSLSKGPSDNKDKALEKTLKAHAVKENGEINWDKTADALIESLNELIPDEVTKDKEGKEKTTVNDMLPETAAALKELITQSGETSIEGMAKHLQRQDLQLDKQDQSKKESLLHFLTLNENFSFKTGLSAGAIDMFKEFLNKIDPGLGTLMFGFFEAAGIIKDNSAEAIHKREASVPFKSAFDFIVNRDQDAFLKLKNLPITEDDGTGKQVDIKYNRLSFGNSGDRRAFMEGTLNTERGPNEAGFTLGQRAPKIYTAQSFDKMILEGLVEEGVVAFKTDQDRQDFIDYAKQTILGGQVGPEFTQRLEDNGTLTFKTDAARDEFTQFTQGLSMSGRNATFSATDSVIEYLKDHDDIDFKKSVAWDKNGKPIDGYNNVKNAIAPALEHYSIVSSGTEFANRMLAFAEKHDGVDIKVINNENTMGTATLPLTRNAPPPAEDNTGTPAPTTR